jgi:hypothetical protein
LYRYNTQDKEALQKQNAMLRTQKDKLEQLCRELQRANKNVMAVGRRTLTPPDPPLKGAWAPRGFNPAPIK